MGRGSGRLPVLGAFWCGRTFGIAPTPWCAPSAAGRVVPFRGNLGYPWGALQAGEGAIDAALRESHEEAGVPDRPSFSPRARSVDTSVLDLGFWSYTTVLGIADDYFEPVAMDLESAALEWVPMNDVADRDLHPAFHRAWPGLRDRLALHHGRVALPTVALARPR